MWCLPYQTFCDLARRHALCSEEAPRHTMPHPFENFDCKKYVNIPNEIIKKFEKELLVSVLREAFYQTAVKFFHIGAQVDIAISSLAEISPRKYRMSFTLSYSQHNGEKVSKKVNLDVTLDQ
jgi:hypothetical protein